MNKHEIESLHDLYHLNLKLFKWCRALGYREVKDIFNQRVKELNEELTFVDPKWSKQYEKRNSKNINSVSPTDGISPE